MEKIQSSPLTVEQVYDRYLKQHFSRTPEEINSFANQLLTDGMQEQKSARRKNEIVDDDGFITVTSKKKKSTKSKQDVEPIFSSTMDATINEKSLKDLYTKATISEKDKFKNEVEELKRKFKSNTKHTTKNE